MTRHPQKSDFPVSQVRRYLEPGPIVLVSSQWQGKTNIMMLGWHTVLEFSPSLVGCMISGSNHSFQMIRNSRECVINLPTRALTDVVVGIGKAVGLSGEPEALPTEEALRLLGIGAITSFGSKHAGD